MIKLSDESNADALLHDLLACLMWISNCNLERLKLINLLLLFSWMYFFLLLLDLIATIWPRRSFCDMCDSHHYSNQIMQVFQTPQIKSHSPCVIWLEIWTLYTCCSPPSVRERPCPCYSIRQFFCNNKLPTPHQKGVNGKDYSNFEQLK